MQSSAIAEAAGLQAAGTAATGAAAGFFIPSVAGALTSYGADRLLRPYVPNGKERCVASTAAGAVSGCATGAALEFIGFGVGAIVGCVAGAVGSLVIGTGLSCFFLPRLVGTKRRSAAQSQSP